MTINPIGDDKFEVQVGRGRQIMTLDEVMFLLSQPSKPIPKQSPAQSEIEEFWGGAPVYNSFCSEVGSLD